MFNRGHAGHKFRDRTWGEKETERSPVFVQFLDVVHQLMLAYPRSFEFNEWLLLSIIDAMHTNGHSPFRFNNEKQSCAWMRSSPVCWLPAPLCLSPGGCLCHSVGRLAAAADWRIPPAAVVRGRLAHADEARQEGQAVEYWAMFDGDARAQFVNERYTPPSHNYHDRNSGLTEIYLRF
jgi:hypothetical protein